MGGTESFCTSFQCAKYFLYQSSAADIYKIGKSMDLWRGEGAWLLGWSCWELSSGGEHCEVCRNLSNSAGGGKELPWNCSLVEKDMEARWACPDVALALSSEWCSGALSKYHREGGLNGLFYRSPSPLPHHLVIFLFASANT